MTARTTSPVLRRLTSAEGYLELGLPELALQELERITEPGSLSVPVMWMTAEALKELGRYDEAIAPLRHVARSVPSALRRQAWESLSECLRSAGKPEPADGALTTTAHFTVDGESEIPTNNGVKLTLPHVGTIELKVDFDQGLTISIRKAE